MPVRRSLTALLLAGLVAACAGPTESIAPAPSSTQPSTPAADPETPAAGPSASPEPVASPSAGGTPGPVSADPPPLALTVIASGLTDPIGIVTAPDGWLLVQERAGLLRALHPGRELLRVSADLRDRVGGGGERGLLGVALHPAWPDDPRAFVHYTDRAGTTVLAELRGSVVDGAPVLDPSTERMLLEVEQPFANHNGGQLAFGPDGRLYLGLGDGGSGGDPLGHGQDPGTLLGSILRLDVERAGRYRIPPDNPFADGGGAPEVHLYGLRNPWRFSFDRATGQLWIADVGQNAWEEVNRLDPIADAGANLGWSVMEASSCFADPACSSDGLWLPLAEYGHGPGCSVTGGHVYRGSALPDLAGWYVFADYCSGSILGVPSDAERTDGGAVVPRELLATGARIASFGEDTRGELYVADLAAGTVLRIGSP